MSKSVCDKKHVIFHAGAAEGFAARKSSAPAVRRRTGAWGVRIGESGLVDGCDSPEVSTATACILAAKLAGSAELGVEEMVHLFSARGAEFRAVCAAADQLRRRAKGDVVTYGVNRNINYTNVCTYGCGFCAFSKGKAAEALRGTPYVLPLSEVCKPYLRTLAYEHPSKPRIT